MQISVKAKHPGNVGGTGFRLAGWSAVLAAGVLLAAGCAHLNQPLQHCNTNDGYHIAKMLQGAESNDVFVILSLSGGGTRAAAFAYGVMEQLHRDSITLRGRSK